MEWFVDNWYIVVAILALITTVGIMINKFWKLSNVEKIKKIKNWLLAVVIEAEKIYGGNTGQAKLSYVYGLFKENFSFAANFISFETFKDIVDDVLEKMRKLLEENVELKRYVESK